MPMAYSATNVILIALQLIALAGVVFSIVHALRQRADAFTAAEKLSKPIWLMILTVALLLVLVFPVLGFFALVIAAVAIGVYLADVRPKVDDIQRGPRW